MFGSVCGTLEDFFTISAAAPKVSRRNDDSLCDRLSSQYTVAILLGLSALVGVHVYVGDPIKCWAPQHFTDSHIAYTKSLCWVKNTYYLPIYEPIPKEEEQAGRRYVSYYRWVPFILVGMAFLFYLPSLLWNCLNSKGGVGCWSVVSTATSLAKTEKDGSRKLLMTVLTNQIRRFLGVKRPADKMTRSQRLVSLMRGNVQSSGFGAYIVTVNLVVKFIYLLNVVSQFVLLDYILDSPFSTYGFTVMRQSQRLVSDQGGNSKDVIFPHVTMCDFHIRRLGSVHRYSLQCTLPINLFNEKLFLFLWFWYVMLGFVSTVELLTWLVRTCWRRDRMNYIQNHLCDARRLKDDVDGRLSLAFVDGYLRHDGVFLMRLVGHNTNRVNVTDIIGSLWDRWLLTSCVVNTLRPAIVTTLGDEARQNGSRKNEEKTEKHTIT